MGYWSGLVRDMYGRLGLAWLSLDGWMDGWINCSVLFCLSSGIHKSHGDRRSSSGCSGVCVFVYDLSNFIIITLLDSFPFLFLSLVPRFWSDFRRIWQSATYYGIRDARLG